MSAYAGVWYWLVVNTDQLLSVFFNYLPWIAGVAGFSACVFLGFHSGFFSRKPVRRYEVMIWLSFLMGLLLMDGKHSGEILFWVGMGVLFFAVIAAFFSNMLLDLKDRWIDSPEDE